MAKYVLTNKAVEDLGLIWNYTYEMWSENQADIYYQLLISSFEKIARSPAFFCNIFL
ncbi:plasmid stabilization system protein [Sphingobacterium deserti]|uniref:Plasmid stabilization system protein n=1 Tax=Sphingobacterium deserti TaxID=1229276 RepID=A0A0B8SZA8_9SPHI|nr:plasmid stabilization system protein [Sphingobacterium deserti]